MKGEAELKTITTKNLLALFRAERKRMFQRGYTKTVIDENDEGEAVIGWTLGINKEETGYNRNNLGSYVDYMNRIQTELNSREHVSA